MDQLILAYTQGQALVTQDDDYLRLHAQGMAHSGIVYVPRNMSIGVLIRGLMLMYQVLKADDIGELR